VVIDCRPRDRVKPRDAVAFAATERACAEVGWRYRLAHEPDPVRMANLRWLAGYRHTRCRRDDIAAAVLRLAATPQPVISPAQRLGDPLGTLPVIFHLLWSSELNPTCRCCSTRTLWSAGLPEVAGLRRALGPGRRAGGSCRGITRLCVELQFVCAGVRE
jgi:hypothetical protein